MKNIDCQNWEQKHAEMRLQAARNMATLADLIRMESANVEIRNKRVNKAIKELQAELKSYIKKTEFAISKRIERKKELRKCRQSIN